MTVPHRSARPHFELEIDNEILRKNLRTQDPVIILALLSTVDLAEPGALDLICDVVELRARRAPEHELWAWSARARAYLLRLIGDAPARSEQARLVN